MTSTSGSVQDYLAKQLFIEKNVVTYRSLSRAFGIHVNAAKNELASFHCLAAMSDAPTATYQITGEPYLVRQPSPQDENSMNVDTERRTMDGIDGDTSMPLVKSVLVGERQLQETKFQFMRISSLYVYCLSPSPLRDPNLICSPTEELRQIDNAKGAEFALLVGKIVGAHVEEKAGKIGAHIPAVASTSKIRPSVVQEPKAKNEDTTANKGKAKSEVQDKEKERPEAKYKPTGKLDFSQAKSKAAKMAEAKEAKEAKSDGDAGKQEGSHYTHKPEPKKEKLQRGRKRRSVVSAMADSDSSPEEAQAFRPSTSGAAPVAKFHRGVVLSDDEDVPQPSRRRNTGGSVHADSDAERELRAMMEIDDGQVVRASRGRVDVAKSTEEEEAEEEAEEVWASPKHKSDEEDVSMSDHHASIDKKLRKKKVKKVVPVGQNGLKKKRIVKSRMKVDDKGYMVTEDYSEYESVDEEEPEPEAGQSVKAKKQGTSGEGESFGGKAKAKAAKNAPDKPSAKGKGLKKGTQSSLANFFSAAPPTGAAAKKGAS